MTCEELDQLYCDWKWGDRTKKYLSTLSQTNGISYAKCAEILSERFDLSNLSPQRRDYREGCRGGARANAGRTKINAERDLYWLSLYKQGKSDLEIAEIVGVTRELVCNWRSKLKLKCWRKRRG